MAQPFDFAAIIAGLETAGLNRSEIARRVRISPSYVTMLARGDRRAPSMQIGMQLLSLAAQVPGEIKVPVFPIVKQR